MRQPDEVTVILRERFRRDYPSWARGHGSWPWPIALHPPSPDQRANDPIGCHEWASSWASYTGPGTIEYSMLRFPTARIHRMPKRLVLARPGEVAAAHPEDRTTWLRCGQRLTRLQEEFPRAIYLRVVRRISELTDPDFERLRATAAWLGRNPTSGMLLRQLPIEGIDTKWLARHATLVLALLGNETAETDGRSQPDTERESTDATEDDTGGDDAGASRRRALHARLGLRVPPDLVQVSVCGADLRAQVGGMRHFAASVEDLNCWQIHPRAVAILENKETGYAVTEDLPGVVILHGHGRYVEQYTRIGWVRDAQLVIYWGDLDVSGLQFVSDLRARGVPARTILTDRTTLERYRHLTVDGPTPPPATTRPAHLTHPELELHQLLLEHARINHIGLLLEQERIPWPEAAPQLRTALSS